MQPIQGVTKASIVNIRPRPVVRLACLPHKKSATYSRADCACAVGASDDEEPLSTSFLPLFDEPARWEVAAAFGPVLFPASTDDPGCTNCVEGVAWGFVRCCCGSHRETAVANFRPDMFLKERGVSLHLLSLGQRRYSGGRCDALMTNCDPVGAARPSGC